MKTMLAFLLLVSLSFGAEPQKELPRFVLTANYRERVETFELCAKDALDATKKLEYYYHVKALTVKPKENGYPLASK